MATDGDAEDWPPLSPAERRDLLWLARHSIGAAIRNETPPQLARLTPALLRPTAAFVSLHIGDGLRGCVGTLAAADPLHVTVAHTARAAAFDDPRFSPLAEHELARVAIEISRLGPMRPAHAGDVRPGTHGVCVRYQERRGVFLPQVATTYGWDRDTLLTELCLKAMLPPDAWRWRDTEIEIFEAEVFGDRDEGSATSGE